MPKRTDNSAEIDKWRRNLEAAEQELLDKTSQWREVESLFSSAVIKLCKLSETDNKKINDSISALKKILRSDYTKAQLEHALNDVTSSIVRYDDEAPASSLPQNTNAPERSPATKILATPVTRLLTKVHFPVEHNAQVKSFVNKLGKTYDEDSLYSTIEEVARFLESLLNTSSDASVPKELAEANQMCALLISEVLYQLLERLSLPTELGNRLERLKDGLSKGLTLGEWSVMLEEVADMASEIRSKIQEERTGTEDFLKQVTERLDEFDTFVRGTEQTHKTIKEQDEKLHSAVSDEISGIHASFQQAVEINKLKHDIEARLSRIGMHFETFRKSDTQTKTFSNDQVRALLDLLSNMQKETDGLRQRIKKERQQALVDTLTGVANRLAYEERLKNEYARWKRFQTPLVIAVWDVDLFKTINDKYGHLAGDNALKAIAKLLKSKTRETDFLARYGGEEFVLLMTGADKDTALVVAEKLRSLIDRTPFHVKGEPVKITISCGIAEFREGDDPSAVFARADEALYQAKNTGRNKVVVA